MKQISVKDWKKFLKREGLVYKRTKGSHEVWDREDDSLSRPVIFQINKK
ncbi:MAG: hypothetical protein ABI528_00595 [bacterium]